MATRRKRLWLNFLGGYGGIGETLNLLDPGKAYKLMLMQISEAKELDWKPSRKLPCNEVDENNNFCCNGIWDSFNDN